MSSRLVSGAPNLAVDADPFWQGWAERHGFEYQVDWSDLVGRYFEARPVSKASGEQHEGVIRGTWGDLPFTYFHRRTWRSMGAGRSTSLSPSFVLHLPGALPADVLAMTPDQAFKALGGELPRTGMGSTASDSSRSWS